MKEIGSRVREENGATAMGCAVYRKVAGGVAEGRLYGDVRNGNAEPYPIHEHRRTGSAEAVKKVVTGAGGVCDQVANILARYGVVVEVHIDRQIGGVQRDAAVHGCI